MGVIVWMLSADRKGLPLYLQEQTHNARFKPFAVGPGTEGLVAYYNRRSGQRSDIHADRCVNGLFGYTIKWLTLLSRADDLPSRRLRQDPIGGFEKL